MARLVRARQPIEKQIKPLPSRFQGNGRPPSFSVKNSSKTTAAASQGMATDLDRALRLKGAVWPGPRRSGRRSESKTDGGAAEQAPAIAPVGPIAIEQQAPG